MKALILNSGMGSRMGEVTKEHPKCMTVIKEGETILSRQLKLLQECGISEVVMTTGLFDELLVNYCNSLNLSLHFTFIKNPMYQETNYIYSIYLAREYLVDDMILMHGDLVFDVTILKDMIEQTYSCMAVSKALPLPVKDFKAVIENNRIKKIGIDYFESTLAAQPLYKFKAQDWKLWLERIKLFCQSNKVKCYAEDAFNEVSSECIVYPLDFGDRLCAEIDTVDDLKIVRDRITK